MSAIGAEASARMLDFATVWAIAKLGDHGDAGVAIDRLTEAAAAMLETERDPS